MTSSTIDPNIPATGSSVSSGPMRSQFQAAINDINALYGLSATANIKLGAFPMPTDFNPSAGQGNDDSAAFTAAMTYCSARGLPLFLPPAAIGYYVVGDIVVPSGMTIFSMNPANYAVVTTKTVLRRKAGAARILDVRGAINVKFEGFDLDGVDRTPTGIGGTIATGGCFVTLVDIGIRNCNSGLGDSLYLQGVKARSCSFFGNVIGVMNTLDADFIDCNFSANTGDGVQLNAGANNNNFVGGRYEFNGGNGMTLFECGKVSIHGQFDHNNKAGLSILNSAISGQKSEGIIVQDGSLFTRNGRNATSTQQSHIVIQGGNNLGTVQIGKIFTQSGNNDDGMGAITPLYSIDLEMAGSNNLLLITEGADLSGNTTGGTGGAVNNLGLLTKGIIRDCKDIADTVVFGTKTLSYDVTGSYFTTNDTQILNSASQTFAISLPILSTFKRAAYRLEAHARDASTTATLAAVWNFTIATEDETGAAVLTWANAVYGEVGTAAKIIIGAGTAGKISLAASAVANNGSSFTLTVNNQLGDTLGNFGFYIRPA